MNAHQETVSGLATATIDPPRVPTGRAAPLEGQKSPLAALLTGTWVPAKVSKRPRKIRLDRPAVLQRRGDGMLAIPCLSQGVWTYTTVSAQDAWATEFNWFADRLGYVKRNVTVDNRATQLYLHRCVLARVLYPDEIDPYLDNPTDVDHRDRRPANNTRRNLRLADDSAQNRNQARRGVHPGVAWDGERQRWQARITWKGVTHYVGRFISIKRAVAARNRRMFALGIPANHHEPEPTL